VSPFVKEKILNQKAGACEIDGNTIFVIGSSLRACRVAVDENVEVVPVRIDVEGNIGAGSIGEDDEIIVYVAPHHVDQDDDAN